jgi:glycyl-tRNA synthetase beta chain
MDRVMADLLLELLCEEIPARMQARACEDLKKLVGDAFAAQALTFDILETFATPRRLALHVTGLPMAQADLNEELKGPRTDAPEQALAGFLKKTGLTKEQLEIREDGKKGQVYFAVLSRTGRATTEVIADIIPDVIRKFPWPKSMRWGERSVSTESLRWVRPLQSILCLLNNVVVPFEVDGLKSANVTRGHRFMSMSQFTVESFDDYKTKLRMSKVILDPAERMKKIDEQARALADGAGLVLVEDAGLLAENAGLTEWPVVLMGTFDPAYLDVPAECLTATMRANQKYFSLRDTDGKMANKFLCTANLEAKDGGKVIVAGNEKVLSARLSDAKFFWDQDRKKRLEDYLPKLQDIVFHEKLGTVAEKVSRVEKLAEHLARELYPQFVEAVIPAKAGSPDETVEPHPAQDSRLRGNDGVEAFVRDVRRAATLSKADLVTDMVGEFPELQGIMGRYYATAQGENADVAAAIEEHYKPQGQNDTVPTNPVSVVLALADKIDAIAGFFMKAMRPTGSKDPFALRRAALGILALVIHNSLRLNIRDKFAYARQLYLTQQINDERPEDSGSDDLDETIDSAFNRVYFIELRDFISDRLKVQQRDAGVRHDIIDAVFAQGDDDLVRLLARVKALQAFLETDDGTNLLAGYKRAANILKIEEKKDGISYALEAKAAVSGQGGDAEKNLTQLFADGVEMEIETLLDQEKFDAAMSALARLRAPVDAFFNDVMVNDPDPAVRVRRLKLLAGVRDAMHMVADFSKIEG